MHLGNGGELVGGERLARISTTLHDSPGCLWSSRLTLMTPNFWLLLIFSMAMLIKFVTRCHSGSDFVDLAMATTATFGSFLWVSSWSEDGTAVFGTLLAIARQALQLSPKICLNVAARSARLFGLAYNFGVQKTFFDVAIPRLFGPAYLRPRPFSSALRALPLNVSRYLQPTQRSQCYNYSPPRTNGSTGWR